MTDSFRKLKTKFITGAIIKSLVTGIAFGLGAVGVVLLALKLSAIELNPLYYVLIGTGCAVLCGALAFLLLRPTDKKIAEQIDNDYSLNEKIQTMVAYDGVSGDVVELQRQDASERLKDIRGRRLNLRRLWQYIVLAVVGIALFLSAVLVPGVSKNPVSGPTDEPDDPPVVTDTPFEYTLFMQSALDGLKTDVRSSSLNDADKQSVLDVLDGLDSQLQTVEWVSDMKTAVLAAVVEVDGIIEATNTFTEISAAIYESDPVISNAVVSGVTVYQSSINSLLSVSQFTYNYVKGLEAALDDSIESKIKGELETSCGTLKVAQADGLKTTLDEYSENVAAALSASGVADTDPLYQSLNTLVNSLATVSAKVDRGWGDSTLWDEIDNAYTETLNSLVLALSTQSYSCIMDEFIRRNLANIFGLSLDELPELSYHTPGDNGDGSEGGDGEGEEDEGSGSGGGYGEGNEIYGSDDLIYDPDTGTLVKYSEVIDKYYEIFLDWYFRGLLPEDVAQYVNDYFDILYSGIPETDSGNND